MTREERVRWRLANDGPFFAEHALKIVGPGGVVMPLLPKPGQLRLYDALEAQRKAGKPQRAIILKARKLGFSTAVQGLAIQRTISRPNHKALVVAQDHDTAGELFEMGDLMYHHLPLEVRPTLSGHRKSKGGMKLLAFGEPSRARQLAGELGLNSSLNVDSAQVVQAGRGFTYRTLHASEVAFWPDLRKLTSLLNAVPEEPDTLVVLESTANGHNFFKDRWDAAVQGTSSYAPVFAPWHEEAAYRTPFHDAQDREEFEATVGVGEYGEDEPRLIETFGCDLEQLHWRRRAITDKCEGKVEVFDQEYPATPEDAFMVTGKKVFAAVHINRVLSRTALTDPVGGDGVKVGILKESATRTRVLRSGTLEVPTGALWVPRAATGFDARHAFWRVFGDHPQTGEDGPPGQYVIGNDIAGEDEDDVGNRAWHTLVVIDHRTGDQVAEWRARCDLDEVALQAVLGGLFFNQAWVATEMTGGWGGPVVKKMHRDYAYPRVYRRHTAPDAKDRQQDRWGWDTNRRTKPMLEAGAQEMLREETDGIRSRVLAGELVTYVRHPDGRSGPEAGAFSDLLMAWMIARHVGMELPIRPERKPGQVHSTVVPRR